MLEHLKAGSESVLSTGTVIEDELLQLDKDIPDEILLYIVSYLSYNDVISLLLANKRINQILESNRKWLPKTTVKLVSIARLEKSLEVSLLKNRASWHCFISQPLRLTEKFTRMIVRKNTDTDVVEFYNAGGSKSFSTAAGIPKTADFPLGIIDGLTQHLKIILSRATIDELELINFGNEENETISEMMTSLRSSVRRLEIRPQKEMGQSEQKLIEACRCSSFVIHTEINLPDRFFQWPQVRRLSSISVFDNLGRILSDDDLLGLSAETVVTNRTTALTIEGVATFLNEWYSRERDIDGLYLHLFYPANLEMEWRKLLSLLKCDVIENPRSQNDGPGASLRRPDDENHLRLRFSEDQIYVYVFYSDR